MERENRFKTIVMLIILSISIALSTIISDHEIFANETENVEEISDNREWSKDYSSIEDGFKVEFNIVNMWDTGYNAQIRLYNLSDNIIRNWKLAFDFESEIKDIWNANIESYCENNIIVSNCGYNQNINPGEFVEFGFVCSGKFGIFPSKYSLVGSVFELPAENYSVDYCVVDDWGEGFTAEIVLKNKGTKTIEDWELSFYYDRTIENIWNANIINHERNVYVIRNCEYNATIYPGETIIVGFNGRDGSNEDLITNCRLIGSDGSTEFLKNDNENPNDITDEDDNYNEEHNYDIYNKIEIALNDLKIGFEGNDSPISVTQKLELTEEIYGIPVIWTSSNLNVIDKDGNIHRPYDKSVFVDITAEMLFESKRYEKSFRVKVIKTEYENFGFENILLLDNIDQLFLYNSKPEDVDVFLKDDGRINILVGRFCDISIESPAETLLALYGVKKLIGIDSVNELKYVDCYYDEKFVTYNFIQLKDNIPVEGSYLNVTIDYDGNTVMLNNGIYIIDNNERQVIDKETAEQIVTEYDNSVDIIENEMVYLVKDNSIILTWRIIFEDNCFQQNAIYVDANKGNIIQSTKEYMSGVVRTSVSETGVLIYDVPTDTINDKILLVDHKRKIYILEREKVSDLQKSIYYDCAINYGSSSIELNNWKRGVSVYDNIRKVYDYYKDGWGIDSIVETKINNYLPVAINVKYDNIGGSLDKNALFIEESQRFAIGNIITDDYGEISVGNSLAILAHEYTHGVIYSNNKNLRAGGYDREAAAINEGYADVMGLLISNSKDWIIRYPGGEEIRDGKSNIDYSKLTTTLKGAEEYRNLNEDYGHKNGLVLSKACYLMLQKGITKELLEKIIKHSLLHLDYSVDATFKDVKEYFWISAKLETNGDEHILSIVQSAFEGVGIDDGSRINAKSIRNLLNCRVVSAEDNTPLENVKISIKGKDQSPIYSMTLSDGLYTFYTFNKGSNELTSGEYYIEYSKKGYKTLTRKITVEDSKNIYLDIAKLIPYDSMDSGTVSFSFVDSENKSGIKGLTVNIFDVNEKCIFSGRTDAFGKVLISNLSSGYYSVKVKDLREYDSVGGRENTYVAVDRFYSVSKFDFDKEYNIALIKKGAFGSMRIILEWGDLPKDLDAHLKGYDDYSTTGDTENDSVDRNLYYEEFHIMYNNKEIYDRGDKEASLDIDDVDGYGPETITVYKYNKDKYLYYIYQYTDQGDIRCSEAVVRVYLYENGIEAKTYIFTVPQVGSGKYWSVFCYYPNGNKIGEKIVPLNNISMYEPLG